MRPALVAAIHEPAGGTGPSLWFVENLLLAAGLVFTLLHHFVAERARMRAELEREQARSESLLTSQHSLYQSACQCSGVS